MILRRQLQRASQAAALAVLNRYPRIAFIHVPKCAGSSVQQSLCDAVYPAPLWATRFYRKIDLQACHSAANLLGVDVRTCSQAALLQALSDPFAHFVTGHVIAQPEVVEQFSEWKFVTVLREPTARFISAYVFHRYKPLLRANIGCDFADFLGTDRARFAGTIATQYFSGMSGSELEAHPEAAVAAALDNLERFFSVGFVEDLESWARSIGRALGRKVRIDRMNPSPNPEAWAQLERSPEFRDRVEALCAIDRQLYEAAQKRFNEKASMPSTSSVLVEPAPVAAQLRSR
jgi:hypothetical protein